VTTALIQSQKIFDVNPWDFEPDFNEAAGKPAHRPERKWALRREFTELVYSPVGKAKLI